MKRITPDVPTVLRIFFMIHFFIDIVVAVPLFLFPSRILELLGWAAPVEPVTTRLFAAALLGIGIQSLIGTRGTSDSFIAMLSLKIVWSFAAACGLLISMAELSWQVPVFLWVTLGAFAGLGVFWTYWRIRLVS